MRTLLLSLLLSVLPLHAQLKNGTLVNGELRNAPLSVSSSDIVPEVAWYKFNDGSGTTAVDSTGNGNTGTLLGNPTWGTGPNSTGDLVFDGTGDYVTNANEGNFDYERTDAFTITAWIKANSSATGQRDIASKQHQSGNFQGIVFRMDTDNLLLKIVLLQSDGAQVIQALTANSGTTLNTWYFVAATYDGSSANTGLIIYRNGTDVTDTRVGGPLSGTILNDNPFWIGAADGSDWFGEIDDVRVYNRVLTVGEISTLNTGGAK